MKILVQFPTRGRPGKFLYYLKRYIEYANDKDNLIINVNCDTDDESMNNVDVINLIKKEQCVKRINFDDNNTKIEAVNRHISKFDYDILLLASDDMLPIVKGYDDIIRNHMKQCYPDLDGVLWFFDGTMPTLNTLSIMGKKYFDRFGYIYHEDYVSLWADNEFGTVAESLGKQTRFEEVIIKHYHPGHGLAEYDSLYRENESYFDEDEVIFNARKKAMFPVKSVMKGKKR